MWYCDERSYAFFNEVVSIRKTDRSGIPNVLYVDTLLSADKIYYQVAHMLYLPCQFFFKRYTKLYMVGSNQTILLLSDELHRVSNTKIHVLNSKLSEQTR